MSDIAIRAKHCIVSGGRQPGVEGLSQRCHIGRAHSHGDSLLWAGLSTEVGR